MLQGRMQPLSLAGRKQYLVCLGQVLDYQSISISMT